MRPKPLFSLFFSAFCFLAASNCTIQGQNAVKVFQQVSPTVVRLYNSTSTGTGVVLTKNGMILTNAHVVSSPLPFHCTAEVLKDGKRQTVVFKKVKVTKIHRSMDLAIVEIDPAEHNARLASCRLSKEKNPVGQRLYAIGNPATESKLVLNKTITEGLLSGVDRLIEGVKYYQISAAINPGNSGGPLCDGDGTVVGIVTLKQTNAEGVGFAIPVFDIQMADFEPYRRKTINARKAVELLKKSNPLMEQVRLATNIEVNRKDGAKSLELALTRAILFQICQEAAHYDPNNPEVFVQLGLVSFMQQEYDASRAFMLEAIRLSPGINRSRPFELLGKSLAQLKRHPDRIIVGLETVSSFPYFAEGWQNVGTAMAAEGMLKEGAYFLRHAWVVANNSGDRKSAKESMNRFVSYTRGLDKKTLAEINGITVAQISENLKRLDAFQKASYNAKSYFLVKDFAEFIESEIGTKIHSRSQSNRIFKLLSPDEEKLSEANCAFLSGKFERAIGSVKEFLTSNDTRTQRAAKFITANSHQKLGFKYVDDHTRSSSHFYSSATLYRQLKKLHGPLSQSERREFSYVLYNEACTFGLDGNKASALASLRESFSEGFPNPASAMEDDDLKILHNDSDFQSLVRQYNRRR